MRRAEDIKKGQQCCGSGSCDGCPYHGAGRGSKTCCDVMTEDTLRYIGLLENQVSKRRIGKHAAD